MSEARALTNFTGNAVATMLIGKWVGEFDARKADDVLSGRDAFDEALVVGHGAGEDTGAADTKDEGAEGRPVAWTEDDFGALEEAATSGRPADDTEDSRLDTVGAGQRR
jgi:aerobic C4-dicarboxylate transport protein